MMDDLISRQRLLRHVENQHRQWGNDYDAEQILGDLEDFPSAQQWISAHNIFPGVNGKYLVTGKHGAVNIIKYEEGRWYGGISPIAWMPLPSPYREEAQP